MKYLIILVAVFCLLLGSGCAPSKRFGMIEDPKTGLQYGSVIERSFFLDSSQFENDSIKVSARNVSGDINYNIRSFEKILENAFISKGYSKSEQSNFGIKFDVIIEYSGHVQQNMSDTYGFLGAAAGGVTGYRSGARAGTAIGVLGGATLGAIAGSYVTDDTYIIVARVNIGIIKRLGSHKKQITFSSSPNLQNEESSDGITSFDEVLSTRLSVFAGGRSVRQVEIVEGVKDRLLTIITDII